MLNKNFGMKNIESLNIKIFADGADKSTMLDMAKKSHIQGLTTNPTLMKAAGIRDYRQFAQEILTGIQDKPISFEVFSDEFEEMERQALEIASWGKNVYVKIPVTNTRSVSSAELIKSLVKQEVKLNITAILTLEQVAEIARCLNPALPSYVSVFAGRIADTGRDPLPIMQKALEILKPNKLAELIWASPRELLNVIQANDIGCHVITATPDILKKLSFIGKDLGEFSLDTVKMFHRDAKEAGFDL